MFLFYGMYMGANPFSDSFVYPGRKTEIQKIVKYANINGRATIRLYGPRCVGKKTLMIHILGKPSFRNNTLRNNLIVSNTLVSPHYEGLLKSNYKSKKKSIYSIFIPPFTEHEVEEYILYGLKNAGRSDIKPTTSFLKKIYAFSSGSPCVISVVMYYVFRALDRNETWISAGHFEKSRKFFEADLWLKYFNRIYRSLSPSEFLVLKYGVLNNGMLDSSVNISRIINKDIHIVTKIIHRLNEKGVIYTQKRGTHKLFSYAFHIIMLEK